MQYKPKQTQTQYLSRYSTIGSRRSQLKNLRQQGWKHKPLTWLWGGNKKLSRSGRY